MTPIEFFLKSVKWQIILWWVHIKCPWELLDFVWGKFFHVLLLKLTSFLSWNLTSFLLMEILFVINFNLIKDEVKEEHFGFWILMESNFNKLVQQFNWKLIENWHKSSIWWPKIWDYIKLFSIALNLVWYFHWKN
jgi:hypothetical protein